MARIFISHSYLDEAIAYKLVNFLLAALRIEEEEIFCSSNPDQGLFYSSSSVPDQLKEKLKNSESLIVLITADSLHSAWIPFEAGAFWTTDKPVIPILGPSLSHDDLPGPLRSLLSIPIDAKYWSDEVNNAINQLADQLDIKSKLTKRRNDTLREFFAALKAWQSKQPAIAKSLESKIEQLEKELEEVRAQKDDEIMVLRERLKELSPQSFQAQSFTEDLGNGIKLEMIAIPDGKFMMGTEDEEIERLLKKRNKKWFNKEKPQHQVTVQPFFMGKYPITQAQWKAITSLPKIKRDLKPYPSHFKGDERPLEEVSWDDAVEFCQRISKQTGKEYRLPSEAEWEYACRAGTTTLYHFGETITDKLANYGINIKETTLVGQFPPNAFGLYDMHGNVREWCLDDWHENYIGAPTDGSAWFSKESSMKVLRGGSWNDDPSSGRSAYRIRNEHDRTSNCYGFRVVCIAP
ncbi:MAG: SUMF1/EgtB/PvdO family nonheme iron enzyme [Xenococcus sp. MO_188.B8]|nr:SUMF1/EgtB/PvdO family nonheme iron enzyme [Xenococcus sp. MO_188.B8]